MLKMSLGEFVEDLSKFVLCVFEEREDHNISVFYSPPESLENRLKTT